MNCSLCRDTGWLLECKDKLGVATMKIIPCLIPDCPHAGRKIELISVDYLRLKKCSFHPKEKYVMSLSRGNEVESDIELERR